MYGLKLFKSTSEVPQDFSYIQKVFALEPGYYEAGSFGLRHENINLVVEAQTKVSPNGWAI